MNSDLAAFRSITMDQDIEETEINKFLKWGKGDLSQALNYYYVHLEKGKIKKKNNHPKPPKLPSTQTQNQKAEKGGKKEEKREDQMVVLDISDESNSQDAFSLLRRGSEKHQKTQDFIEKVRNIYQLPIRGKQQRQLVRNSSASVLDPCRQVKSQQFDMVDCLTDAFNPQKLSDLVDRVPHEKVNQSLRLESSDEESIKFQECEYKHVYTSNNLKQNDDKIEEEEPHKSESEGKRDRMREIQKPIKRGSERDIGEPNKNKRVTRSSKNSITTEKQKKLEVHKINPVVEKSQTSTASLKKIMKKSGKQIQQQIDPEYPFSEVMEEEEIYMGEYFVRSFATEKKKLDDFYQGCQIMVKGYIEEVKTKKKSFGKKQQRDMHMRMQHEGRTIGRLVDDQVRILMPLIHDQLIRVEFFVHEFPPLIETFTPILLKAKVYFSSKIITEPIVESFEPNESDRERVHQISGLLAKLSLPLLVEPLVKGKSKYIKAQENKKKKESIDLLNFQKDEEQDRKRELQRRNEIEMMKKRTDPLYNPIQKSIKDMISKRTPERESEKSIKNDKIVEGLVQKKVIEIDTKVEKDKYSELIELHEQKLEPFHPSPMFTSKLYNYQALALSWMLCKEGFSENKKDEEQIHPLWSEYEIPASEKYRLFFNELTGQLCVKRPKSKIQCKGGILADEMGLGKTVMMAALMLSHKEDQRTSTQAGTLVVVPLTLISQWEAEIHRHTKGLSVLVYYSGERKKHANSLHHSDVVISTYGTISHQFAQGCHIKKSGIYKYKWHRIILDEAHYIKGRIIQTSKAVYEISGSHRWCLTGTPIQNSVDDLFSLLHFIKYTPWSEFACWTRFIAKPLSEGDESIYPILKTILKRVFLRRTKNSLDSDGKPIVELPPRISKVQLLTMSKKQREFYDSVYAASRDNFDNLIEKGILEAKYMQVLEMLMRLRQICCHPVLFKSITKFSTNLNDFQNQFRRLVEISSKKMVQGSGSEDEYFEPLIDEDFQEERVRSSIKKSREFSETYFKEVMGKIESGDLDCCLICLDKPEDPVINYCLHIFCKSCNIRQIQEKGFCGSCRTPLSKESFIYLPRENRVNIKFDNIFLSTKIIALKEHFANLKKSDKVVVFSQFLGMLDLVENQFKKESYKYVRMEGSNTHKERTKIVNSFQNDPNVQIFLVSLKTAGVGLNLVAANKVFLLDPWWNPAVEEQAIERVHRIGQKREVQIVRLIMDKTIETRMLELNTEKKNLSHNVLSHSKEQGNVNKVEKIRYLMENY